ncbi:RNA polymerase sigma factor [Paraconexibacter sp. AEG42_29]|uniref:RNA polymerase sigma factor n=1 Tax=Paraconexibacter sp. AEG42_29 TaxID=2997339 RepID=A0AAU7AY38_9ACTN
MARPADSEAFRALFAEHYRTVCRYLSARTQADQVEDVAGEVFLIAWRRRGDLPADPVPWLLGTARKCLANQRRSRERAAALAERLALVAAPPADDDQDSPARRRAVLAALAAVSEADRELLLLSLWDGLPPRAIAAVMRLPPVLVRTRLSRASRRLQSALTDELDREDLAVPARLTTTSTT